MEVSLQVEPKNNESPTPTVSAMIRTLAHKRIEKDQLTAKSSDILKTVYDANPEHFKAEQDVLEVSDNA